MTPDMPSPAHHQIKFIFVTGGVVSSLGKGLAAASIGALLEGRADERNGILPDMRVILAAGGMLQHILQRGKEQFAIAALNSGGECLHQAGAILAHLAFLQVLCQAQHRRGDLLHPQIRSGVRDP